LSSIVREGSGGPDLSVVDVEDERTSLARQTLTLIRSSFDRPDRQPMRELRGEMEEKRLGLLAAMDFHLLAARTPDDEVVGTVSGIYLEGVNAGFVTYLAVAPAWRGRQVGSMLRALLVQRFRDNAMRAEYPELAWVLGEVRADSPWLRNLLERRTILTFHVTYVQPDVSPGEGPEYVLYRQPLGDERVMLPADEVRRILYAVYRRGYRVSYPLEHPGFQLMLRELDGVHEVGEHPDYPPGSSPGVEHTT